MNLEIYAGASVMLLHRNGKLTIVKLKSLCCRNVLIPTDFHGQFHPVSHAVRQTYLHWM